MKKIWVMPAVTAAGFILTGAVGNDAASTGNGKNFSIVAVFMLLILLRGWRISLKTRKREQKNNKTFSALSKRYPKKDELDDDDNDGDDDYPSGFGGNFIIKNVKNADGSMTDINPFIISKKDD